MATQVKRTQTTAATLLIAEALVRGLPLAETLTHLAVGAGPVAFTGSTLKAPLASGTVQNELGRVAFKERKFVVADPAGPIVAGGRWTEVARSNRIYFLFQFLAGEALGNWSHFGLFGGGVQYLQRGATLLDIGGGAGDDHANVHVLLTGAYSPATSQSISVNCTTGGGSGAAKISWVSDGSIPSGSNVTVAFNTPVPIPGSGLALTFTGGPDTVLTQGAQWEIRGTRASETGTYAAGGVYDAITNPAGQVLAGGDCFELIHRDPPFVKGAAAIEWRIVVPILKA